MTQLSISELSKHTWCATCGPLQSTLPFELEMLNWVSETADSIGHVELLTTEAAYFSQIYTPFRFSLFQHFTFRILLLKIKHNKKNKTEKKTHTRS